MVIGYLFIAFFLILLAYPYLGRLRSLKGLKLALNYPLKVGLTSILVAGALALAFLSLGLRGSFYAACRSCPFFTLDQGYSLSGIVRQFPELIFFHTVTTIPIFILGCFIASLIGRISFKLWPRNIFHSFLLAAVLPICSCGVIPIVKAMLEQPQMSKKAVLAFLIATPILSPMVMVLSWGVLGIRYALLRIAFTFLLAIFSALFIGRLWVNPQQDREVPVGEKNLGLQNPVGKFPLLLGTWKYISSLSRYIVLGLLLGSGFAFFLPGELLRMFMRNNIGGILAMASVGIPIHLCSGAEVLILTPFVQMGLPLGHALAFTISGAGICISSIPLLYKVVGKRITIWLVISFWVGSIFIGALINLMIPLIGREIDVF
jgi:uncharacterized membrane protein YraQ (UPF0718 family)